MRKLLATVATAVVLTAGAAALDVKPAAAEQYLHPGYNDCSQITFAQQKTICFDWYTAWGPIMSVWSNWGNTLLYTAPYAWHPECVTALGPAWYYTAAEYYTSGSPATHTTAWTYGYYRPMVSTPANNSPGANFGHGGCWYPRQSGAYTGWYDITIHFNGNTAANSWAVNAAYQDIAMYWIVT